MTLRVWFAPDRQGMNSRIGNHIEFPNYEADELVEKWNLQDKERHEKELAKANYLEAERREKEERQRGLPSSAIEADWKRACEKGVRKEIPSEADLQKKRGVRAKAQQRLVGQIWKPKQKLNPEELKEVENVASIIVNTTIKK